MFLNVCLGQFLQKSQKVPTLKATFEPVISTGFRVFRTKISERPSRQMRPSRGGLQALGRSRFLFQQNMSFRKVFIKLIHGLFANQQQFSCCLNGTCYSPQDDLFNTTPKDPLRLLNTTVSPRTPNSPSHRVRMPLFQ